MNKSTSPYAEAIAMERAKISEYEKRIAACLGRIAALEGLADGVQDDVDAALERKLRASNGTEWNAGEIGTSEHEAVPAPSLPLSEPVYPGLPPLPKLPAAEMNRLAQALPSVSPFTPPLPSASASQNSSIAPPLPAISFVAPPPAPTPQTQSSAQSATDSEESSFAAPKRQISAQAIELLRFLRVPATLDSTFDFVKQRGLGMNRASLSTFLYAYRTKYGFLEWRAGGTYVLSERGHNYIDAPLRRDIKFEPSDAGATASEEE